MVLVDKIIATCNKYNLPTPLEILFSTQTKSQLKNLFKKKIIRYWHEYFCSQCTLYSSLAYFDPSQLIPSKPHSFVINSGTSNFLNYKSSVMLSLLWGRYLFKIHYSLNLMLTTLHSAKCAT